MRILKVRILWFWLAVSALAAPAAVEWRNLDAAHDLGGRKASAGYLQGKVVLVARWNAEDPAGRTLTERLEEIWQSFKSKHFVVLGAPTGCGAAGGDRRLSAAAEGISFPLYADAGLGAGEPRSDRLPLLYVVDETGRVVYLGRDERNATQAVVTALTDMDAPKSLSQWRRFLDFEIENLPARACGRIGEFRRKFPREAAAYAGRERELLRIPDVKKVAELVAFAKRAKDAPAFGPHDGRKKERFQACVRSVLRKSAPLKETSDPRLVREAKNALADLAWVEATF